MIEVEFLISDVGQFPHPVKEEKRLHQTNQSKTNQNNKEDCVSRLC